MSTLKIENLHVSIGEKEILKGIDLVVNTGETMRLWGQMVMENQHYYQLSWGILNI